MEAFAFSSILFGASLLAGALGAMLGLGGGVIIVPALTLLFGLDMRYAIGASVVSVIATSSGAAATYVRDRITNLRLGMFLEIATTTGAVAGAWAAGWLPARALSAIFGVVLLQAAWTLARSRPEDVPSNVPESRLATRLRLHGAYYDPALARRIDYRVTGVLEGLGIMWIAGLVSGLLGIGSGTLKVVAMDRVMRVPMKVSTTTSDFMIGVTAAASAGIYFMRGDIHPFIAAPVTLGTLLGTVAGTRLLLRLRGSAIRKVFLVVLIAIALQMLWRALSGRIR